MSHEVQTKYLNDLNALIASLEERNSIIVERLLDLTGVVNLISEVTGSSKLVPKDVGLEFTPNWPPARKDDAIEGRDPNSIISPLRLDEYMDANLYTPLAQLFEDALNDL